MKVTKKMWFSYKLRFTLFYKHLYEISFTVLHIPWSWNDYSVQRNLSSDCRQSREMNLIKKDSYLSPYN